MHIKRRETDRLGVRTVRTPSRNLLITLKFFVLFFSGVVAERVNLRYFLSMGMLLSGVLCYMFGLARSLNIHSLPYFIIVQILMGVFQTTGWPAVVTIVGHWFGKGKRGNFLCNYLMCMSRSFRSDRPSFRLILLLLSFDFQV